MTGDFCAADLWYDTAIQREAGPGPSEGAGLRGRRYSISYGIVKYVVGFGRRVRYNGENPDSVGLQAGNRILQRRLSEPWTAARERELPFSTIP